MEMKEEAQPGRGPAAPAGPATSMSAEHPEPAWLSNQPSASGITPGRWQPYETFGSTNRGKYDAVKSNPGGAADLVKVCTGCSDADARAISLVPELIAALTVSADAINLSSRVDDERLALLVMLGGEGRTLAKQVQMLREAERRARSVLARLDR